MSKGCLIKGLIISTVVLAGIFYVLTVRLDDWVLNPIKDTLYSSTFDEIEKNMNDLKDTQYKDSLVVLFKDYAKKFKSLKEINLNDMGKRAEQIGVLLSDSLVSKEDFDRIKYLLEKSKNQNEKSKES